MKRLAIGTLGAVVFVLASPACLAKIVDCPAIARGGVEYSSHDNYVQAVRHSTGALVWRTVLFTEPYTREFDPQLEEDVQWNIACLREVQAAEVVVSDRRGRIFRVSRASGKLIAMKEAPK